MNPTDLIGKRLFGEYTIVNHLGEGAIGAVYLARQDSIDKRIAVKVLNERSRTDEETVERFQREALAISMLTHPNIIRVLIFGRTDEGLMYLAMEYVEGKSLEALLREGTLSERRAIKIFKQIVSALAEAHEMGIVHRDLKPENVLLTTYRGEKDFVKILDFGMAKFTEADPEEKRRRLSQSGIVYGTPAYLSPEQAQALDLDHRSDIYSVGCMLYELLTGKLPFDCDTAVQMLSAHVNSEVTPPSRIALQPVSAEMEKIILKAMAKRPEDRFQTALEMLDALLERERELGPLDAGGESVGAAAPAVPAVGAVAVQAQKPLEVASGGDMTRLLIGAALGASAMFLLMVFLGAVFLLVR